MRTQARLGFIAKFFEVVEPAIPDIRDHVRFAVIRSKPVFAVPVNRSADYLSLGVCQVGCFRVAPALVRHRFRTIRTWSQREPMASWRSPG